MTQEPVPKGKSSGRKYPARVGETREGGRRREDSQGGDLSGDRGQDGSRLQGHLALPRAGRRGRGGARHDNAVRLLRGGGGVLRRGPRARPRAPEGGGGGGGGRGVD